jgi:hypothetical protein
MRVCGRYRRRRQVHRSADGVELLQLVDDARRAQRTGADTLADSGGVETFSVGA